MATAKESKIGVRLHADLKTDFDIIAEHRGLKSATLLHTLIVKFVRDERKRNPSIFEGGKTMTLQEAAFDDERKRK